MIRPATVGFAITANAVSPTRRDKRENNAADPSNTRASAYPKGDARKKPNRVERPGRRLGETRQSARASEKRRGCRSPAQRCERRAEIQHRFRRAAQLVFVRIGHFVRRAFDACHDARQWSAEYGRNARGDRCISNRSGAQARALRRSRSRQHADAMRPVKPASGPTEPPNTIGSKKPTTDLPAPSTR